MPLPWDQAVRWYRRASRERAVRGTVGGTLAAVLDSLRTAITLEALRQQYRDDDRWPRAARTDGSHPAGDGRDEQRLIDAAYGLRWLEIRHELRFDLSRSLVRQVPLTLLETGP